MKGVSPGIRRSVPAGTAAAGTAGPGSRTAARDEATLNRPSSALPRPPAATPRAAAPAPTIRKRRRSSPLPPGPALRSPVPSAGPAVSGRAVPRIARTISTSVTAATAAPASVGTTLRPPPWLTAAATPTAANTARAASP